MEDYLYQKDLFLPLGGIPKKPTTTKDEEYEVLDRKALGTIRLSLEASVAFNISKEKTTKEMMDTLDKLYEKPSESNKVFLMKRLFNMKMSKGGSVVDNLNEFNTVTNQLSSVKVDFDDEARALRMLCSFPEIWNDLVMAISNSGFGSNTLKFDDVVGVILSEEMQ
jgi:glycyl-tRNA synthetase beta subunit